MAIPCVYERKTTIYNKEINGHTSAETAIASNHWSQFRACNRGLNRVSKFDTTPNFTPAFLRALNAFSASGSQRCQAYGKKKWRMIYNYISLKLRVCNLWKLIYKWPNLVSAIVVVKFFKVLRIWTASGVTDYILPERPCIIDVSAIKKKKTKIIN